MPTIKLKSINRDNICAAEEYNYEYEYLINHLNEDLLISSIDFTDDGRLWAIIIRPDREECDTPCIIVYAHPYLFPPVDFELKGVTLDEDCFRPRDTED